MMIDLKFQSIVDLIVKVQGWPVCFVQGLFEK